MITGVANNSLIKCAVQLVGCQGHSISNANTLRTQLQHVHPILKACVVYEVLQIVIACCLIFTALDAESSIADGVGGGNVVTFRLQLKLTIAIVSVDLANENRILYKFLVRPHY